MPNYQVHLLSYHEGWFCSTAQILMDRNKTIQNFKIATQPQIKMYLKIYHGPLVVAKNLAGVREWFLGLGVIKGEAKVADFPLQIFAKVQTQLPSAHAQANIETVVKETTAEKTTHVHYKEKVIDGKVYKVYMPSDPQENFTCDGCQ